MKDYDVRKEFIEVLNKCIERPANFEEALLLATANPHEFMLLLKAALFVKEKYFGKIVTYSRKVFIPLTNLCRNKCAYCGFRKEPGMPGAGFLTFEDAMKIVKIGEKLGAKEVLVSTGEKPETKYEEAIKIIAKKSNNKSLIKRPWSIKDLKEPTKIYSKELGERLLEVLVSEVVREIRHHKKGKIEPL